jgi:hypothetical protein
MLNELTVFPKMLKVATTGRLRAVKQPKPV